MRDFLSAIHSSCDNAGEASTCETHYWSSDPPKHPLNTSIHRWGDDDYRWYIILRYQPVFGGCRAWELPRPPPTMILTPPPPLGRLRLAKLSDVPRIAVVAAAGFWHSPVFQYERPRFNRYPYDTLASYRREYQQAILDPKTAVLVIEDEYRKDEVSHAYDALSIVYPTLHEQLPPEEWESSTLIVGVGSLRLQPQGARYGAFQPEGESNVDGILCMLGH